MSLRHALLGLLDGGPASGYDLLGVFGSTLANVWPATQSQVYTELTRLADTGRIEVVDEGPRGRKTYGITDAGREDLRHWILDVRPDGYRRNDVLLRVFLLGAVTPNEAADFLRGRRDAVSSRAQELASVETGTEWGDDPLSVYGRLALEWGKRFFAMQAEWSAWAVAQLEAASADPATPGTTPPNTAQPAAPAPEHP